MAVQANTLITDINSPQHPAQKFVAEAESHVGSGGHAWVQSLTGIGSSAWCAATMCAVAITCGFADVIMPRASYWAAGFGKDVVETYGGEFLPGPGQGVSCIPQTGDIIEYLWGADVNDYPYYHTRYASDHVGVVKEVNGDTVVTIEGNTGHGQYMIKERNVNSTSIHWYARPNWAKVGGATTIPPYSTAALSYSKLYSTRSSREDASIREFGYLDSQCQPSIKKTNIWLSAINYTSLLGDVVDIFNGSTPISIPDNIDQLPPVLRTIVNYLRMKGLNTAAAIGILANMKDESNFVTKAVGLNGSTFGICMWPSLGGRADEMKRVAGKTLWSTNLSGQLTYLWQELSTKLYTTILVKLRECTNTLEGAQEAAEIFARNFKPLLGSESHISKRKKYAEEYWSKVIVYSQFSFTNSGTASTSQSSAILQSGKQVGQGTSIQIPESVVQTGIIPNYTHYPTFFNEWHPSSIQYKLSRIWDSQGRPSEHSIATINGNYLIACTETFGTTGDLISVVLDDGTYFNAIIGDSKGGGGEIDAAGQATSRWGHLFGSEADVIEWESVTTNQSQLREDLKSAGWFGKNVAKIINYGTWLDGSRT